ncbi:MAG: Na+/H+ antiporter subunit E [Rhodoferax sp.]|jgi:multicomponent K+:H+ antiporter subunit E|nr:Na+/H+ antiporter subunit E [Rhodoferax sp.]
MKPRGAFPHPLLSLLLAASWLALQQSVALPHCIVAALLGWGLPRLLHGFLGPTTRLRNTGTVLKFILLVVHDIVVANFAVARIVLSPWSQPQPGWVVVPLDIRHPTGIVLLATVITTTPGTVSCIVDEAGHRILVHALDCPDAQAMAADMKARYERPLMEMFE